MKLEKIGKIRDGRQDGAISNGFLFSFNHKGECTVYRMEDLESEEIFAEFTLDRCDELVPHGNSVSFGCEYFDEGDEFPLLYSNIYNNYAKAEDRLEGVSLVYRIQRDKNAFSSALVQIIQVGFTKDCSLWCSDSEDRRPYGNFTVDKENGLLYAFTMRDIPHSTRYFAFSLPRLCDGEVWDKYGVKRVVLEKEDILHYFDCDYHHYVQGATCHGGKIYSLEGFTDSAENPPAIRVIDTEKKKEADFTRFCDLGTNIEPEMIDFHNGTCYYADHLGNVYNLIF